MSEEILENIETPIEENGMGNILEDLTYKVPFEIPQRVNPFCVISKDVVKVEDINGKKHDLHMIETNSAWGANPYGDAYAVVPDDMYEAIMETHGFCDIELNEDGTEVVSFTAREIPVIPEPPHEPTAEDRIAELEESLAITELTMIENYEAQEEINSQTENALIEIYEMMEG